jgi:hypothetical protein
MKTKNQFFGLIAIAIIAIGIIACKSDEPTGGTEEQPIGNVGGIPIYGFNSETAIININTAWNHTKLASYKDKLSTGIKKIYIVEGMSIELYSFDKNTGFLTVGSDGTFGDYLDSFLYIVVPELSMKMLDNNRLIRNA